MNKVQNKIYKKLRDKTRKALRYYCDTWEPWDYGWLEDSIITQIKGMRDYYQAALNIGDSEESRLYICNHLLELWDQYKGTSQDILVADDLDDVVTPTSLTREDFYERYKEEYLATEQKFQDFWSYFIKNYRQLWD